MRLDTVFQWWNIHEPKKILPGQQSNIGVWKLFFLLLPFLWDRSSVWFPRQRKWHFTCKQVLRNSRDWVRSGIWDIHVQRENRRDTRELCFYFCRQSLFSLTKEQVWLLCSLLMTLLSWSLVNHQGFNRFHRSRKFQYKRITKGSKDRSQFQFQTCHGMEKRRLRVSAKIVTRASVNKSLTRLCLLLC